MDFNERGFLGEAVEEWRRKNIAAHREAFTFAYDVSQFCERTKFALKVHPDRDREVIVTALFLKMLADYQGAILLLERGAIPQGEALLRCALEAFFLIAEMVNDEEFAARWNKSDDIDRLRMLENAVRAGEGGVPPNVDPEELAAKLAEVASEADKASKVPGATKMLQDKQYAWMHGFYQLWSFHVHSSPRGVRPYLGRDPEGVGIRGMAPSDKGIDETLAWGGTIMAGVWRPLTQLFGVDVRADVDAFEARFQHLMRRVKRARKK